MVALGRRHDWHEGHAEQVARLALELHRQIPLEELRHGPADEWLEYGALLHDIGCILDYAKHHKHAERLIRAGDLPGFDPREIDIIALVARFHRKRPPEAGHAAFGGMERTDYLTVRGLSALLRVADGLDRGHRNVVRGIVVRRAERRVEIGVVAAGNADLEMWAARRKSDLLAAVTGCRLVIGVIDRVQLPGGDMDHARLV